MYSIVWVMEMIYSRIIYLGVSFIFVAGMVVAIRYAKQSRDYNKQTAEDTRIIKNVLIKAFGEPNVKK